MIQTATDLLNQAPTGQTVVDIGCYGWRLADACATREHFLIGIDEAEPPNKPCAARFVKAQDYHFDLPNDTASITVASHVLEHVLDPIAFFKEMMRITQPGGTLWIEAPSEYSTIPSGSNDPTDHRFLSFWDDPTHIRPWTPGALYRLALGCYCVPHNIERAESHGIPVVRMRGIKPSDCFGTPPSSYVSFMGIGPGLENAWNHVWGKELPREPKSPAGPNQANKELHV